MSQGFKRHETIQIVMQWMCIKIKMKTQHTWLIMYFKPHPAKQFVKMQDLTQEMALCGVQVTHLQALSHSARVTFAYGKIFR